MDGVCCLLFCLIMLTRCNYRKRHCLQQESTRCLIAEPGSLFVMLLLLCMYTKSPSLVLQLSCLKGFEQTVLRSVISRLLAIKALV